MQDTKPKEVQLVARHAVVAAKALVVGGVGRHTGPGRQWVADGLGSDSSGLAVVTGVAKGTGPRGGSSGGGDMTSSSRHTPSSWWLQGKHALARHGSEPREAAPTVVILKP